ncbi:MAG: hypothetical protein COA71_14560 [SAR86 cluster bacterium]|uniref:Uncharacterized protein n=1 Tax=SAR86 cluster bacterium TaxID=2030880 RepID=A0A2A5C6B0_9GAMM|nr:MAG: hypothetical protein COA71_14560 [SAR86 cluster bacterium]
MSHFCQFCDKEMVLAQSIVYVRDYITCGAAKCAKKAKKVSIEIYKEQNSIMGQVDLLVFRSKNPEDEDSWGLVEPKDQPAFLKNSSIVDTMLLECVLGRRKNDDYFYLIRKKSEVQDELDKALAEQNKTETKEPQ